MPPCIPRVLHSVPGRISVSKLTVEFSLLPRRLYTTTSKSGETPERKDVLTFLHRVNAALPSILLTKAAPWSKIIGTSGDILSGVNSRKSRIAVLGLDTLSQPTELVSALLDDPLSSDTRNRDALRNRRRERPNDVLVLSHGESNFSTSTLSLNLPWLKKLNAEIVEIPSGHPDPITLLYDADIRIFVVSPLATRISHDIEALFVKAGSLLILNYPTFDQHVADLTVSRLMSGSDAPSNALIDRLHHAYPSKALSALDLFNQRSHSAEAVQVFQDDFLGSGVTAVSQAISRVSSFDGETRRFRHAQLVLTGALETCCSTVANASRDAATVLQHVEELQAQANDAHDFSIKEVLGGEEAPAVGEAVQRATREMRTTMDGLQWWKLPFKVDDLKETLSYAVEHAWCRDLEAKLQFETGRLSSLREALTAETHATLRFLPIPFHSAVLTNTLHQLSARPPDLAPNTLTYPLTYRLQQLQYPILNLHRKAQRIVFATVIAIFGSVGGAYAAWFVGWVTPPTALGLGALGAVAGLRWLVGNWEKRKRLWWEDWRRVGEGLERDTKEMLALVVREKVAAVPRRAAEELEKSVALRLSEIEEMNAELESLETTSRRLYPQDRLSGE